MNKDEAKEQLKQEAKKQLGKKILSTAVGKWVLIIGIALAFIIFIVIIICMADFVGTDATTGTNGIYDKYNKDEGICALAIPVKVKYYVTSLFGYRNSSGSTFHNAVDLGGMAKGTPVYAALAGKVSTSYTDGWGNYVTIISETGEVTQYLHLNKITAKSGSTVAQGDKIGEVGGSGKNKYGNSYGVHLDFRYKNSNGKYVSINNMFGYTDIPEECVINKGEKSSEFRSKCMIKDSRKMTDLEKEQFTSACNGTVAAAPVGSTESNEEIPKENTSNQSVAPNNNEMTPQTE